MMPAPGPCPDSPPKLGACQKRVFHGNMRKNNVPDMSSLLPLNALRAFEAVIRNGSFSAAADELCVTQSAISHQIRHLEDWFGAPLFIRDGNRPRPAPHAEDLARTLSLSFGEIRAACQRAKNRRISQPLVVAAIPSVAVCWLIPRLAGFRKAHPAIDIRIIYAMHGHDIDFQDVHLAFVFAKGMPALPGIGAEPFLPGDSVPVCSPALAARLGDADPVQAMASLGLLHDTDPSGWQEWFDRAGLGDAPPPGPVFEDFNLLRAAALSGQGVALCPEAMIRQDLEAGHLIRLSRISVLEEYGYYLLWGPLAANSMQAQANAFRDWVFAERDGGSG